MGAVPMRRNNVTACFSILPFIGQPIILRENRSRITVKYSQASRVQILMLSTSHDVLGNETSTSLYRDSVA